MERQRQKTDKECKRNKGQNEKVNHMCNWNPRGEKDGAEAIFEEKMVETFQKLMKDLKPHGKTGENKNKDKIFKKSHKEKISFKRPLHRKIKGPVRNWQKTR